MMVNILLIFNEKFENGLHSSLIKNVGVERINVNGVHNAAAVNACIAESVKEYLSIG